MVQDEFTRVLVLKTTQKTIKQNAGKRGLKMWAYIDEAITFYEKSKQKTLLNFEKV